MITSAFRSVTWMPGMLIDEDSMNQMNNNMVSIKDTVIQGTYQHSGDGNGFRKTGIKIICGRIHFKKDTSTDNASQNVYFAEVFTSTSTPIITTGINVEGQRKIDVVFSGLRNSYVPTSEGFQARIKVNAETKKNDNIASPIYVNWIAMGY